MTDSSSEQVKQAVDNMRTNAGEDETPPTEPTEDERGGADGKSKALGGNPNPGDRGRTNTTENVYD